MARECDEIQLFHQVIRSGSFKLSPKSMLSETMSSGLDLRCKCLQWKKLTIRSQSGEDLNLYRLPEDGQAMTSKYDNDNAQHCHEISRSQKN